MPDDTTHPGDLNLEPLGIEEVHERLEISPLLAGADSVMRANPSCTCKVIRRDDDDDDGDWVDNDPWDNEIW